MPNLDKDFYLDKQGLRQLVNELETNVIAEEYSSSATYAVGAYCIHDNKMYRCTTAITTAENWNSAHWSLILIGDELKSKKSGTVTSVTIKGTSPIVSSSESAITTSGTRTISHADSGVTAGTYKSVTVNATGHVTEGTNPTTLSGYGITDAKIESRTITLGSNSIQIPTITDTYSGTSSDGMSGKAVKSAIDALDGGTIGTPGASKTLTALSQTNGNISATFGDIAIANTQVSGLGTASTKDVPTSGNASSTQVVMGNDTRLTDSRTPTSHSHGNIANGGIISSTAVTPASGDYLLISDTNASGKIERGIALGTSTTTYLTNKGTWATPVGTTYTGTGLISVSASNVISTTAEVNQNAFSTVKVGATSVSADTKTDTLTLEGSNVTLTPDATNDKVTIGITSSNVTDALGYTPYNSTNPAGYTTNTGTVTSITLKGTSPIAVSSESAITTSGTRTISLGTVPISKGGTGATTALGATDNLGALNWGTSGTELASGTNIDTALENGKTYYSPNSSRSQALAGTVPETGSGFKIFQLCDYSGNYTIQLASILNGVVRIRQKYRDGSNYVWGEWRTFYTDYTLTSQSAASGGTAVSLVTTGEKYTWNNKSNLTLGTTSTTALKGDTKYAGSSSAGGSATSAAKLDTSTAGSATQPCYFANGVPSACTYSLNKTVPSNAVFTDTTYTFANGTNGFTVTPSGGSAQTVTVTPSITNNVTGSGTSGYIAKFNGTHTVTNGPHLGSSTTTYLNNAGSWATPPDTKNTAGSTDTSSKIFLIGATSQAANPQTYSDNEVYATSGVLTTKSVQVGGGSASLVYDSTTQAVNFVFA
jgi:hypothetical protein